MSAAELVSYKPDNNGVTPGQQQKQTRNGKVAPEEINPIEMNGIDSEVAVIDRTSPTKESSSETEPLDGKKKKEAVPTVSTKELFRYATCKDVILMISGTLCAMGHGAALPMMFIVFGEMTDSFVNTGTVENIITLLSETVNFTSWNLTKEQIIGDPSLLFEHRVEIYNLTNVTLPDPNAFMGDILDQMTTYAYYYVGIGCGVMLLAYVQVAFWMLASEGQAHRIRQLCFRNIMHQEIGWFDTHQAGELNNRLTDDVLKIHDGIGDKIGGLIQWTTCSLTGFIIGFAYGWKLALVILAVSPALAIAAVIMTKIIAAMTSKELKAYSKAGAIAEEVLGSIRTVFAFGGQEKECARYNAHLEEAKNFGIKKGLSNGLSMGFVWLVVFMAYSLGFWYGSKLVREEPLNYTAGTMMIVFFGVIIGAFSIGNAAPSLTALAVARGAAHTIFSLIERKSAIDSSSPGGKKPDDISGNIEFRNITFNYPSRPDVTVLNGLSLKVNIGDTVALVGASGCGKSTMVSLLLRFYDPAEGQVLIDGHDIRELNIKWFRERIGVVSQEPVLFATSITENIKYGRDNVTQEEVVACAKMANAHNFIMQLPDKYETLVGERGAQLSGGQKQRIAIARALIRDPKILLLDEATSALDTESEAVVQEALDKASKGRTTIVIAHRLSTIKTATKIAGFRDGVIVEQGTHDELMQIGGIYQVLVENQIKDVDVDDEYAEFEKQVISPKRGGSKRDLKRMLSTGSEVGIKRATSVVEKGKEADVEEEEEEKLPIPSFRKIMSTNASEWPFILLGCFGSLINGGIQPAFAIIFSLIFGTFSELDLEKREREVAMFCLIFIGLGCVAFLAMFVQSYMFGMSGELMTLRLRNMTFKAMLRQEVGWFDDHKNSTGALTTRLATDASRVQGATGIQLGVMIQSIANMGTGMVIAFVYGWKLALLILAFVPFIIVAGALQMKILQGGAAKNKEALEEAGKVAAESIENIRTVAMLVKEDKFSHLFRKNLEKPYGESRKKAHLVGFSFSFSQAIIFFAYAAAFTFGAYLIKEGEMDFENVFKVFSAIVFCAIGLGQASSFAPDAAKAKISAARIFALNERVPEIDSYSTEGEKPSGNFSSKVTFKDVKFFYPSRPTVQVLRNLDLTVNPGETLALVGSSGCGKSTTVQLIERFYDPAEGSVMLDRYDSKNLNVKWLRQQMGIVSQEPVLFDCSIAENIAYGDNTRVVPMDEIINAARSANIHGFIASLPTGYDTMCGDKGTQLSGGQKQRVAIARALVRNPKILLLDEATSALDTESEKLVQVALDKAREGRTCIVIAHRLSTIQNADKIAVIHNGQVVEQGRHSDLLAKKGFYYRLNMAQLSQKNS